MNKDLEEEVIQGCKEIKSGAYLISFGYQKAKIPTCKLSFLRMNITIIY